LNALYFRTEGVLIKDVYIVTKLLILYLLSYIN
jgi:hypothetical protein